MMKRFIGLGLLLVTTLLCVGCAGTEIREFAEEALHRTGLFLLYALLAVFFLYLGVKSHDNDSSGKAAATARTSYMSARIGGGSRVESAGFALSVLEVLYVLKYIVLPLLSLFFGYAAVKTLITGDLDGSWSDTSLTTQNCTYKIARDVVNVRSGPGTTYKKIGRLGNGSTFALQSHSDEWCEIHLCNIVGIKEKQPDLKYGWVYCPLTTVPVLK